MLNDYSPMITSKINEDLLNTSDHHPVSIMINYENKIINDSNNVSSNEQKIWENKNLIKIYPDLVDLIEIKDAFVN